MAGVQDPGWHHGTASIQRMQRLAPVDMPADYTHFPSLNRACTAAAMLDCTEAYAGLPALFSESASHLHAAGAPLGEPSA